MKKNLLAVFGVGCLALLGGCSRTAPATAAANAPIQPATEQRPTVSIPAGTTLRVRLLEALDTLRNRAGDQFTASLDEPLVDGDRVVVPKGTTFTGHILESRPSGRWKGRAVLALTLDEFTLNGQVYDIRSTDSARTSAGHTKHDLAWIGDGSIGGALVGAAAAGGSGALIGAGSGAAAGTVGSVITGKRQVRLPIESTLHFRLEIPITLNS